MLFLILNFIGIKYILEAILLKYAITIVKKSTQDIRAVYKYLLENGSNYYTKDKFGKSCVDYANEYV